MNEYDISEAFRRIENDLIDSLIRNFSRHRAEETKEGYDWDAWQVLQLRELEKYRKNNAHRFDDDFEDIHRQIRELFQESLSKGENEADILGDTYLKDFSQPTFGINTERLDALFEATQNDLEKAEHAVLRKANDEYRKIIFDAQVYADQGGTYEKAVDMATKDFRKRGIQSIVYKNGARHNISSYAEMALRTGGKRAYLMGLGQQMARVGVHTVMVHRRNGACPFCTPWLGKVLVDDVYNEGTEEEARRKGLPLLSEAIDQGFLHPNCKDIYSMYIEGVSKPEEPLTEEEKDLMQKVYDLEQELNKARGIHDSYYRMAMNSLDPKDGDGYMVLVNKWGDKIDELEKELAELKKQLPHDESLDVVPEIDHSNMRELIEVETEESIKGVFEVPEGAITIDDWGEKHTSNRYPDYWWRDRNVTVNKRIAVDWSDLTSSTQSWLRWQRGAEHQGKPFYIQKTDLTYLSMSSGDVEKKVPSWLIDNGYEYLGRGNIDKYKWGWDVYFGQRNGKIYGVVGNELGIARKASKATIDKVLSKEKIISKYLWDNNVPFKDIRTRGDRNNPEIEKKFNDAMMVFHTGMEADRPVSLVSREAYDAIESEEIYRGISQDSNLRLNMGTPPPIECARQLMEGGVGDCYPSRGIYGDGVGYWSNSTRIGNRYSSDTKGVIVRAKVKPDARVIMYDDAVKLFEQIFEAHPNDKSIYFSKDQRGSGAHLEVGKAMQILGYDVILKPNGDHSGANFYIILNRQALVSVMDDYIERLIG